MLVLFYYFFCIFFFSKFLDNLDKIATYSILFKTDGASLAYPDNLWREMLCAVLDRSSPKKESSFFFSFSFFFPVQKKKKKVHMNHREAPHWQSYVANTERSRFESLCLSPGLPDLTRVGELERKFRGGGLSSRSVYTCAFVIGGFGVASQNT